MFSASLEIVLNIAYREAISRRHEGTLVILPISAAIAVCVFGAGVYASAGEWRGSVAATRA